MKEALSVEDTLKLALEALEDISSFQNHTSGDSSDVDKAITTIKEALAEQPAPVQQEWKLVPVEPTEDMWKAVNKLDDEMAAGRYDGKGCSIEQAWDCLIAAAPQPAPVQQEPVALESVYETIIQWDEGGGKRSRRELARRIVSLYTKDNL